MNYRPASPIAGRFPISRAVLNARAVASAGGFLIARVAPVFSGRRQAHTVARFQETAAMFWTVDEGANYEVACETITHVIAIYSEALAQEQARAIPDPKRIEALQGQTLTLASERDALTPDNAKKVTAAIERYSPVVRQHLERHKAARAA